MLERFATGLTILALAGLCLPLGSCYSTPSRPLEAAAPQAEETIVENPAEPEEGETPNPNGPQFSEQDITPAPSPSETPSPTAVLSATGSGESTPAAGASGAPTAAAEMPTGTSEPTPGESASPTAAPSGPTPTPTEIPAALDITTAAIPVQVSNQPLAAEIAQAPTPAGNTAMRLVDKARNQILTNQPDEGIRLLGRALSVDPNNPYVYFYLGRGYLAKGNYQQALTFWQRASIGFTSNPAWLGETLGYEGLAHEELGRTDEARADYQRALQLAPNDWSARLGAGRLGPPPETPTPNSTQAAAQNPAGDADMLEPPPAEAPPPPPPSAPPPAAP